MKNDSNVTEKEVKYVDLENWGTHFPHVCYSYIGRYNLIQFYGFMSSFVKIGVFWRRKLKNLLQSLVYQL